MMSTAYLLGARTFWISVFVGLTAGAPASALSAQMPLRDGNVVNKEPYLFSAEDFGIDPGEVTFTKDIAPILQRSCQDCHHPGGGSPMSLITYEEVRAWAPMIKHRTAIRDRMGAMPPWFIEKNIGVQRFKNDPSLSNEELAKIQAWVDGGSPQGDPADMPPARQFAEAGQWMNGEPDLVLRSRDVTMPAVGADWWGDIGLVPTGLTEDRYVKAVEVREINDLPPDAAGGTVGGRYMWHHMTYGAGVLNEDATAILRETRQGFPIHEVGRNADVMSDEAGLLLAANSALDLRAAHLHPNGVRETTGHLEFGFKFFPEGYEPTYARTQGAGARNSVDVDAIPNLSGQEMRSWIVMEEHTMMVAFEPHMHAPGVRMCLEAVWGQTNYTINCAGYDHNWVKQYLYEEGYEPLLPKGTIVHLVGWLDTTPANTNIADPRNFSGAGRRSVANMFNDLGWTVKLTDEQFLAEMAKRRGRMKDRNDFDVGCPLCWGVWQEDFGDMESMPTREGGTPQ